MKYTVAIGSNLGNRENNILEALKHMINLVGEPGRKIKNPSALPRDITFSQIYSSPPASGATGGDFLNMVITLKCNLKPEDFLKELQKIEFMLGRNREEKGKKLARTIDLDIVLAEDLIFHSPLLTIPHPAMAERDFVLFPLMDITPEAFHPVLRTSIRNLAKQIATPSVKPVYSIVVENNVIKLCKIKNQENTENKW